VKITYQCRSIQVSPRKIFIGPSYMCSMYLYVTFRRQKTSWCVYRLDFHFASIYYVPLILQHLFQPLGNCLFLCWRDEGHLSHFASKSYFSKLIYVYVLCAWWLNSWSKVKWVPSSMSILWSLILNILLPNVSNFCWF
jgi:hypothetical protein